MGSAVGPLLAFGPTLVSPYCQKCGHLRSGHSELIGGIQGTRMHCLECVDEGGPCR